MYHIEYPDAEEEQDQSGKSRVFFRCKSGRKLLIEGYADASEFDAHYRRLAHQHGGRLPELGRNRSNRRPVVLPASLPPRGLSREQAAAYVGVGTSLFDEMVRDGRMPAPKEINSRRVWDRLQLDAAFAAPPDTEGHADDVWSRVRV